MDPKAMQAVGALSSLILRLQAKGAVLCIFGQDGKASTYAAMQDNCQIVLTEALLQMAVQVEANMNKVEKATIPVPSLVAAMPHEFTKNN